MNFIENNVSVEKAVIILSKNGIQVDEKVAEIILELLYLISKKYDKPKEKKTISLTGFRTIVQLRLNL
ncbi:PTS sugar transporter subunit IIBC [Flavobacterium sp. KACC 22763]|uniref:PTS sugar transporter subunit IIBC n=1 Tax=Flavobacterium sp. KACC 22763 TaxID=3025668 RepID=UPI0023668B9A|nr:PTS sugar transporter subunit IIBC [Flavobacterium sp. KACC 22763]WDF65525.1 PTS sugar transporter subunit IIBC [Flavobacterium sp. KACC 22763]